MQSLEEAESNAYTCVLAKAEEWENRHSEDVDDWSDVDPDEWEED